MRALMVLGIFVLVTVETTFACSNCHNGDTHHHYGRRKRSAESPGGNIHLVDEVLTELTEQLKTKVSFSTLGHAEQDQFLDDLGHMHSAGESAYFSILTDNDGQIDTNAELMKTVVARVTENDRNEPWYGRLIARIGAEELDDMIMERARRLG